MNFITATKQLTALKDDAVAAGSFAITADEFLTPAIKTDMGLSLFGVDNADIFAMIHSSQRAGQTCLPFRLGLSADHYHLMMQTLGMENLYLNNIGVEKSGEDVRQTLLDIRRDEWHDLRDLLIEHRVGFEASEIWMAEIVAAGCLGADHLWRDLGLVDRSVLSLLLNHNFPSLAMKNTQDMKWKKYLYKQLCEREGSYVCRAPSCEECVAFDDCFGDET